MVTSVDQGPSDNHCEKLHSSPDIQSLSLQSHASVLFDLK